MTKSKILEAIVRELVGAKDLTSFKVQQIKRQVGDQFKTDPLANWEILNAYQKLVKAKKVKSKKDLPSLLKSRQIRTLSGVAPVAVLTKSHPCPGECIYCPGQKNIPKSYLNNEPAVLRAIACKFDPHKQVTARLRALAINGHPTDKVELIIMGGTWSYLPRKYQNWFIKRCFEACNKKVETQDLASLLNAQKKNEKAKHRIVGLTLETRPDYIDAKEIKRMRELGCTKVEIGVQTLDDKILKLNKRGHLVKETIEATKLLKQAGFKVAYHMMPNLPGSTPKKDLVIFKKLFSDPNFQPDLIKIYPCTVVKGSPLFKQWKQGKFKSYTEKQLIDLLINIKTIVPYYTRIIRVIRDIPVVSIETGNKVSNLREILKTEMHKRKLRCKCIRCREAGHQKNIKSKKYKFFVQKYKASEATEYFLSFESPDRQVLYAFCRLRLPAKKSTNEINKVFPALDQAGLIRELHTYGQLVSLSKKESSAVQHKGLGKKLLKEAEKQAKKQGFKKLAVISGVGVREYYKKQGYKLEDSYMVKPL